MLTLGLVLIVGNILARLAAMPRLYTWARRRTPLPLFSLFMLAAIGQAVTVQTAWWAFHRIDIYKSVQQSMFLPMTALQACSIIESAWWLATCLPRFRKIGCVIMVISAAISFVAARPTGSSASDIELGLGIGLATFVCLTLAVHKVIETECRPALWHAGCLGAMSLFNGFVWALQGNRTLMTLAYVLQVVSSVVWLFTVINPPNWIPPEPTVTEEEALESIRDIGRIFRR